MEIVSSTEGCSTSTGWKRRSSAASFSMCLRYSSSVVAPMQCSSPRASMGFSRLEASIAPSAGLAHQNRVVLGAAGEDLDHAADLVVAPDDRVELPLRGELGEVAAVLLERLVRGLGIGRGDALVAAHLLEGRHEPLAREAEAPEDAAALGRHG